MQKAPDDSLNSSTGNTEKKKSGKLYFDTEEYALRSRLPRKLPKRDNDVYVSRKTDFNRQLDKCKTILESGSEVFIHGLGAATNRAVNLALQLKEKGQGSLEVATHTSTVELIDDFEPLTDDLEPDTLSRNNSAVHIRVYKTESLGSGEVVSESVKS